MRAPARLLPFALGLLSIAGCGPSADLQAQGACVTRARALTLPTKFTLEQAAGDGGVAVVVFRAGETRRKATCTFAPNGRIAGYTVSELS